MAFSIGKALTTFICTPSAGRCHSILWAALLLVDPSYIIGCNNRYSFLHWVIVLGLSDFLSRCVACVQMKNWESAQYRRWYLKHQAVELNERQTFEVEKILNHRVCLRTAQLLLRIRWIPSQITPETVHTLRPYLGDCHHRTRAAIHWKDSWVPFENIKTVECVAQYFLRATSATHRRCIRIRKSHISLYSHIREL